MFYTVSAFLVTLCETYHANGILFRSALGSVLVDGAKGTLKAAVQARHASAIACFLIFQTFAETSRILQA